MHEVQNAALTDDPETDDDLESVDGGRRASKQRLLVAHIAQVIDQLIKVTQIQMIVVVVVIIDRVQQVAQLGVGAERGQGEQRQEEEMRDGVTDELADWTSQLRGNLPSPFINSSALMSILHCLCVLDFDFYDLLSTCYDEYMQWLQWSCEAGGGGLT